MNEKPPDQEASDLLPERLKRLIAEVCDTLEDAIRTESTIEDVLERYQVRGGEPLVWRRTLEYIERYEAEAVKRRNQRRRKTAFRIVKGTANITVSVVSAALSAHHFHC